MKQLVILFIFFSFNSVCQDASFSRLTEADGLPGSKARCFLKDSKGFIWIGTASGLCRYDGFEVVPFTQNQGFEISNDDINAIIQDERGIIWLGTNAGGINSFDPETEKFKSYRHDPNDSKSIAGDRIQSLALGADGVIWIGFDNGIGLSVFNPETEIFTNYDPFKSVSVPGVKAIRSVVLDQWNTNRLWLGTTSGLIQFDIKREEFVVINHPLTARNRQGLFALEQIDENRLVAGFFHAGTDVYFIDKDQWQQSYTDPSRLIRTYDLARKSDTEYWVAARKRGLAIFNVESGNLEFIRSDIDNQNTPFPDFTYSVYSDDDCVWVGSKHGVSYSHERKNKLSINPLSFTSKEFGRVTDFSGKFDKVYIGGFHGLGLYEVDKLSEASQVYPVSSGIPESISGMLETEDRIYITSESRELFSFDKNTSEVNAIDTEAISEVANTISLAEWTNDYGLILTRFGGIYKLTYASNEIKVLFSGDWSNQWVHDAFVQDDGSVWFATNEAVYIYNQVSDSVTAYYPQIISSKNEKHILTIKMDALGTIWMGTTHGLLELKNGKEMLYTVLNSDLGGNAVSQVAFDSENNIWVTTQKGVTFIEQETMQMNSFDKQDGIDSEGILESIDGKVYYGDYRGYYLLSNKLEEGKTDSIHVYITDFQVENVSRELSYRSDGTYQIELDYWEDSFSFSYSSPVFNQPQRLTYAYRLVGLNEEWVYTEKRRFANFTNLDGGEYVFEVKAKTRDSEWSEIVKVHVKLASPFWETRWFYLMCCISVFATGLAIYKVRIKVIQSKADKEAQELRIEAFQKRLIDLNATPPDLHIDMEEINNKLQTPLSEREFETLKLSVDGKSNAEISEELFISISTVKFHLTNTYSKLGVSNRKEALDYVVKKT